jgi:hypothetical protein
MKELVRCLCAVSLAAVLGVPAQAGLVNTVFYIEMENHNLTQPGSVTNPPPLFGSSAAPYLNSLITPGNSNSVQSSWASRYFNVATGVHPSLPNYLWQEGGTNNGVLNDNQPFGAGGVNQGNALNLSGLLQAKGITWKSYQEDIDLNLSNGSVLPQSQWTVPLTNHSGTIAGYNNPYNGSNQYDFATKHDGQLYYNATNGGNDPTPSNPEAVHYAPLQQLATDLANNTVAQYNLITPDQFNDMHTALAAGFTYKGVAYTGAQASVAQGDNFLSQIVPLIMSSQAYQNNGAIVIWFDETEGGDTAQFTLPEIVISPLAKGNAYNSTLTYTHSSDLKSMQELFGVYGPGGTFLGDAGNPATNDLSDLFVIGALSAPEPSTLSLLALGSAVLTGWHWRKRKEAVRSI